MTDFRLERTGKIIFAIGLCVNIAHSFSGHAGVAD
jgi:hypothetical protein